MNKIQIALAVVKLAWKFHLSRSADRKSEKATAKAKRRRKEYEIENAQQNSRREALVAGVSSINDWGIKMQDEPKKIRRWSDDQDFDPIKFAVTQSQVEAMHRVFMDGSGCSCGKANKLNIKWMWTVMCFYGVSCLAGFKFLYGAIERLEHIAATLIKVAK